MRAPVGPTHAAEALAGVGARDVGEAPIDAQGQALVRAALGVHERVDAVDHLADGQLHRADPVHTHLVQGLHIGGHEEHHGRAEHGHQPVIAPGEVESCEVGHRGVVEVGAVVALIVGLKVGVGEV